MTQQVPKVQTGSPQMLSPNAYYLYYHQHSGLQDAKKKPFMAAKRSKQENFKRVLEIYMALKERMLEDLKKQYIHEEETVGTYTRTLESHLDNKIRIDSEGGPYMVVNGKTKFDGSDESYEEHFQSGKNQFARFVREIAKELIDAVHGKPPEEQGKAVIFSAPAHVAPPKPIETIGVDLDNTILDKDEQPIEGAKEALGQLRSKGYRIAIYTARFTATPPEEWQSLHSYISGLLTKFQIPFDEISISKPICTFYIDDRGVKFTNWEDVIELMADSGASMSEEGPQDMEKTQLQKSQAGSGGSIALRENVKLEQEVDDEVKDNRFTLLDQAKFWSKVSEQMNEQSLI